MNGYTPEMMRSALPILMFAAVLPMLGQTGAPTAGTNEIPKVKAGGIDLLLPSPDGDFTEVGDRLRTTVFDLLTPSTNRLLTAYLSHQIKENLLSGNTKGGLGTYAMVEIPRGAEYTDVGQKDFEDALKTVANSMGVAVDKAFSTTTDEINARMKELGGKPISVDRPEMMGTVFRKPDAFAWAMLMGVKGGDSASATTMAGVIAMIRIKQRVLFTYLYRKYDSPEVLDSLGKSTEAWVSRILSANQ